MPQLYRSDIEYLFRDLHLLESDEQYLRAVIEPYFLKGKGILSGEAITQEEYEKGIYPKLQVNAKDSIDSSELEKFHNTMLERFKKAS